MQVRGLWALGTPGQKASGPVHCPQRTQSSRSFRSGQLRAPRGVMQAGQGCCPVPFAG